MEEAMHTTAKALLVFGLFAGAAALAIPGAGAAKAQGFYIEGPGVHVRVGHPHHRYYNYYRGYGADPGHPYGYNYDYGDPRCGVPNFTVQDGVCKPYRGY
jgi:hypothetical protein